MIRLVPIPNVYFYAHDCADWYACASQTACSVTGGGGKNNSACKYTVNGQSYDLSGTPVLQDITQTGGSFIFTVNLCKPTQGADADSYVAQVDPAGGNSCE